MISLFASMDLETRIHWAVGTILENESLTADLTDDEAQRLIEWGISEARRLATENRESLEEELAALRKLMRGANKLAVESRPMDDDRLRLRLERMRRPADLLGLPAPTAEAVDTYIAARQVMTTAEKLERLLLLFGARNPDSPTSYPLVPV